MKFIRILTKNYKNYIYCKEINYENLYVLLIEMLKVSTTYLCKRVKWLNGDL